MKTCYHVAPSDKQRDANNFEHHAPHGDQTERYEHNRAACMEVALAIRKNSPASREQAVALTKLEEVLFWWNAAIARNEKPTGA